MSQIYQLDEKRKSNMDMLESKGQLRFPDICLQNKGLEKNGVI